MKKKKACSTLKTNLTRRDFVKKSIATTLLLAGSSGATLMFPKKAEAYNPELTLQVTIDEEQCIFCGACVDECPQGFIEETDDWSARIIDTGVCYEEDCFLCYDTCPVEAIKVVPEETISIIMAFDLDGNLLSSKLIKLHRLSSESIQVKYYDILNIDVNENIETNMINMSPLEHSSSRTISVLTSCKTDPSGRTVFDTSNYNGRSTDVSESWLISYLGRQSRYREHEGHSNCSMDSGFIITFEGTSASLSGQYNGFNPGGIIKYDFQNHEISSPLYDHINAGVNALKGSSSSSGILKIDENICINCDTCVGECPTSSIELGDSSYTICVQTCNGCGSCACACPTDAIIIP